MESTKRPTHNGIRPRGAELELWGGVECSRVRIQNSFVDQLELNAYRCQLEDFDAFAALGIRKLRFPILWEHVWPDPCAEPDWAWPDAALLRLKALGIDPIVGLMHHSSGPMHTNLLDDTLPQQLALFAAMVARRYPWVQLYTPINEPLTTARFSCLYGLWYPHATSDTAFVQALLVQVEGIRQAMRAIRRHTPEAELVQTEDLGFTHSTPSLAYQAAFENERRWLSFDLLAGHVRPGHPLFAYLVENHADEAVLGAMAAEPCPPALLGINHYITSERYLDGDVDSYPMDRHGGNGRHRYVDIEACRSPVPRLGPSALLLQAWERYRIPIALTEAHLGCSCEEQMRWFYQLWQACLQAREAGAVVQACTAWALTGSCDWDSLLTQARGHFEEGAFVRRNGRLVTNPLSGLMRDLAHGRAVSRVAIEPGWWDLANDFQQGEEVCESSVPDRALV